MSDVSNKRIFSFDDFLLDARQRTLTRGGRNIVLNARAFELLVFLLENAGRVVTKDEILAHVWKEQFVEESNLAVQISSIRKALGENADRARLLTTIPGRGYQFTGVVETPNVEPNVNLPAAGLPTGVPTGTYRFLQSWIGVAVAVIAVAIFAYLLIGYFNSDPPKRVTSIAVLPFANEAPDRVSAFVSDGIADGLILSLSKLPGLRIISRESSFRYREKERDIASIGKELGVDALIFGRIAQIEEKTFVLVELISATDRSIVWGDKFPLAVETTEDISKTMARAAARAMGMSLDSATSARLNRDATNNEEAYQLYLAGRYHLKRLTDDGFEKGRVNFKQAVELDPNFALAHVGLADAYNMLSGWGALSPNEGYPLAKAAALRALELDESLASAHTALGAAKLFYDIDWLGAENEFQRAIALDANSTEAHYMFGYELTLVKRFEDAGRYLERSLQLDPLSIDKTVSMGNMHYFARDYEKALNVYRRATEMDPNSGLARWAYANALLQLKRSNEAITEYQKAIELSGDSPDEPASLAFAYAVSDRKDDARRMLSELTDRGRNKYVPPALLASIHGALGENDRAFELLEQAFRERDSLIVYLKVEPIFDPLRADSRFHSLLARIRLD